MQSNSLPPQLDALSDDEREALLTDAALSSLADVLARVPDPRSDPHQQHAEPDLQTPEQLAAAFARYRQESLALLKQVNDDDLERTARHPQFGTVTLAQLLHTWAAHDLNHTIQAERALMQPFILGGGPWHVFFRDHIIDVPKEEA